MEDVVEDIGDFIQDAWDDLGDALDTVWQNIGHPITEEVFNFLGYEDKTVITGYVVTQFTSQRSLYKPWKKIAINTIVNDTEFMNEIKSYFTTGEHVRAKFYFRYGSQNGMIPTITVDYLIPNCVGAEGIIESVVVENEPVTLINCSIGFLTEYEYGFSFLQTNPGGYTYSPERRALIRDVDSVAFFLADVPFTFDIVNNVYDVNTFTSAIAITIQTAINTAITVNPTYSSIDHTTHHEVIIDTATVPIMPTVGNYSRVFNDVPVVIEDLIPASGASGRQYKVTYTVDSDVANPPTLHTWNHLMVPNDLPPYDVLYTPNPANAEELVYKQMLPMAAIMLDEVWTEDLPKSDPVYIKNDKILKKYGVPLQEISKQMRTTGDPAARDNLTDVFFGFGVSVTHATSQAELQYLFNFFSKFSYNQGHTSASYFAIKADYDFIVEYQAAFNADNASEGPVNVFYDIPGGPDWVKLWGLITQYVDPEGNDFYAAVIATDYDTAIATYSQFESFSYGVRNLTTASQQFLERIRIILSEQKKLMATKFIIDDGHFNMTISYGHVGINQVAGVIGDVGHFTKEIIVQDYQVIIRKQINAGNYTEVHVVDLISFTALTIGATQVKLAAYDFVGSDAGGQNVANNFFIPVVQGFLLELGIYDRKELLHYSQMLCMYNVQVTHIRYYETAEFLRLLDFVFKVVAIILIFWGQPTAAEILWGLAKALAVNTLVERIIQEIILHNPDSNFAIALAVVIGVAVGASVGGFSSNTFADALVQGVSAGSQVLNTYTQVDADLLQDEISAAEDEIDSIREQIDNIDAASPDLLEYIQKQFTMKLLTPEAFYEKHLNVDISALAVDVEYLIALDDFYDVENFLVTNYSTIPPSEL